MRAFIYLMIESDNVGNRAGAGATTRATSASDLLRSLILAAISCTSCAVGRCRTKPSLRDETGRFEYTCRARRHAPSWPRERCAARRRLGGARGFLI